YAVGATIFRLLARRPVHLGTDTELVMKVMSEPAAPLESVLPAVGAEIASIVDRALAFDREDRYPDAAKMRGDVEAVRGGQSPPFAAISPPHPPRPQRSSSLSSVGATAVPGAGPPGDLTARDAATFVPPAKGPPPEAPQAGLREPQAKTRAALAPELLPTLLA